MSGDSRETERSAQQLQVKINYNPIESAVAGVERNGGSGAQLWLWREDGGRARFGLARIID